MKTLTRQDLDDIRNLIGDGFPRPPEKPEEERPNPIILVGLNVLVLRDKNCTFECKRDFAREMEQIGSSFHRRVLDLEPLLNRLEMPILSSFVTRGACFYRISNQFLRAEYKDKIDSILQDGFRIFKTNEISWHFSKNNQRPRPL